MRPRFRRSEVVEKEYNDPDGYWIYLKSGWNNGRDGAHGIVESTKAEAYRALQDIEPCDCEDCLRRTGQ